MSLTGRMHSIIGFNIALTVLRFGSSQAAIKIMVISLKINHSVQHFENKDQEAKLVSTLLF